MQSFEDISELYEIQRLNKIEVIAFVVSEKDIWAAYNAAHFFAPRERKQRNSSTGAAFQAFLPEKLHQCLCLVLITSLKGSNFRHSRAGADGENQVHHFRYYCAPRLTTSGCGIG